ncbi:hypothetical protein D1013_17315 [Euzebyella marina]|uniref:Uncharacterized protein n=1 Tax=Euzebyella marina TaxID=1761453 RepID=A0A3G2L9U5_9FLAO|nr:hypothetical protein [Euzebyella marina]AYN69014.1 hypothetical protein D1013_17315 [Euzebyella marina]
MKRILSICSVVFLLAATLFSCVEEQDFDQYDEIEVTPTLEASMLYVEAPEDMVNSAPSNVVFTQNFNFDAFSYDAFSERVLDGTITYLVENTTSKTLSITIEFLDDQDNLLGQADNITVDPNSTSQLDVSYGDAGRSIEIIKNTSSIRVSTTNLGDTTSVSNQPDPKIVVKSSAKFRVQLK